jgi:site-specific DNA-methyltransferase (adenine-specific)
MELNKIYLGDSLKILKTFPNESVDLIITSPPYNLGNTHHTGNKRHNPYDDNMAEEEYQKWQIEIINELYRVLKKDGSLFYNHKNRIKKGIQITPYQWLLQTQFIIKQELVWFNGSQNFDKIRFYPMTERVYWLAKNPQTKLYNAINHHDFFNKDEWKPVGLSGQHTRAFPERMVTDILKCFEKAEVVLDPFVGSGTTCVEAKKLNRKYIGIEINEEYVKIAEERLNKTIV